MISFTYLRGIGGGKLRKKGGVEDGTEVVLCSGGGGGVRGGYGVRGDSWKGILRESGGNTGTNPEC